MRRGFASFIAWAVAYDAYDYIGDGTPFWSACIVGLAVYAAIGAARKRDDD